MNDDWIKDIQYKMKDFEVDEPQGLWDDICHSIPQIEKKRNIAHNKHITLKCVSYMAAAAAIIAFIFLFTTEDHTEIRNIKPKDVLAKSVVIDATDINMPATVRVCSHIKKLKKTMIDEGKENMEKIDKVDKDSTSESHRSNTSAEQKSYPHKATAKYNNKYLLAQEKSCTKSSDRLSYSMLFSGGTFTSTDSRGNGNILVRQGSEDTVEEEPFTEVKHHMPIKFGILMDYKINKKLSLESGVVFSSLSSDLKEGTGLSYFTGKQQLYYVGIPITVKYQMAKWNHLEIYASAGITLDKCVSAKRNVSHYSDNKLENKESISLESRPFQLSVHSAAGIEYHVTPMSSIYVEPNLGMFFNDGSSLNHLYKDKPIVINFNVGLKINIGNN